VAPHYDRGNVLLSGGLHQRHRARLCRLVGVRPTATVLDLACGTGDLTWMLARRAPHGRVVGVDVSEAMLARARVKGRRPGVAFLRADAGALPFPDHAFDLVMCGFAGRWFGDWEAVLGEVWRVLRPGGRFGNVDFGRPPSPAVDRAYRTTLDGAGRVVGRVLGGDPEPYRAVARTVAGYPGQRWLVARLRERGFEVRLHERQLGALAFHVGCKP
jgi:demethylmenaquinone methyltransferase / 2-methoxy-6-polyprenyl-1,4-benzoquinol methylase